MKTASFCKCCNSENLIFVGNLDSNKACWDRYGKRVFPSIGKDIPYFSCNNCGFVFTSYMDNWGVNEFKNNIYNEDYLTKVNPPLPEERDLPHTSQGGYRLGQQLSFMLDGSQDDVRILDYGAGSEVSNAGMAFKDAGFDYYSYEPYLSLGPKNLPSGKFDFIFAIEVIEHCHNLNELSANISRYISRDGIFYIQTMLHPFPTPTNILNSWYIAPRDGHISIFTFNSITALFRQVEMNVVQTTFGLIAFKNLPKFKNKFFI
jgi:hypothetical protein